MSTTYYAHIKPSKEHRKAMLRKLIDEDYEGLKDELYNIYKVEIGSRAGGWKFCWYPYNKRLESLTKEGIEKFVRSDDVLIFDEYGEKQDKEEFLEMAFGWYPEGCDTLQYYEEFQEFRIPCEGRQRYAIEKLGKFNLTEDTFKHSWQADFESDGLRWTILR